MKVNDFVKWLEGYLDALKQHADESIVEVADTISDKLSELKESVSDDSVHLLDDARKLVDDITQFRKYNDFTPLNNDSELVPYHTICGCDVCYCVMGNRMVNKPTHNRNYWQSTTSNTTGTMNTNIDKKELLKD